MPEQHEGSGPQSSDHGPGMGQAGVIVAVRVAVAGQLPLDHRLVPAQHGPDIGQRHSGVEAMLDGDAFVEVQSMNRLGHPAACGRCCRSASEIVTIATTTPRRTPIAVSATRLTAISGVMPPAIPIMSSAIGVTVVLARA